MSVRCVYVDLDGTLLGWRASLLHDGEGNVSLDGVRAVQTCLRADMEIVLMSGRRRAQVHEDARLLGQDSFIFEAGACVVLGADWQLGGEEHWLTGEMVPGELSVAEQIERSGAPGLLLERYVGRLEYHEPWHVAREVSHAFRGLVDAEEVDALLVEHGHENLRLVDNGVVNRRSPALAELRTCAVITCAGGSLEGGRGGAAHARTGIRAGADLRGGRFARGPRVRAARGRASGWSRTRWRAILRSARRWPRTRTCE